MLFFFFFFFYICLKAYAIPCPHQPSTRRGNSSFCHQTGHCFLCRHICLLQFFFNCKSDFQCGFWSLTNTQHTHSDHYQWYRMEGKQMIHMESSIVLWTVLITVYTRASCSLISFKIRSSKIAWYMSIYGNFVYFGPWPDPTRYLLSYGLETT